MAAVIVYIILWIIIIGLSLLLIWFLLVRYWFSVTQIGATKIMFVPIIPNKGWNGILIEFTNKDGKNNEIKIDWTKRLKKKK